MPKLEDILSYKELIDYTKERIPPVRALETLFPSRKTEALEIEMIKGANNLPVSASIHGFDTETEIDSREGKSYDIQDMALIKRKKKVSEKDIIRLEQPRNTAEESEMVRKIFDDVDSLNESVLTRVEAMRGEALSSGKLVIDENDFKTTIDYGVPSNHKASVTWSTDAPDILGNLTTWIDKIVDDTGFTPTRALTSKKVLSMMLKDATVRQAVYGVNKDRLLSPADLNTFLKSQSLPEIAVYDAKFRTGKKGKYSTKRYFPENIISLLPEGRMGETLYGLTAEELELRKKADVEIDSMGNIIIAQYATEDPVAKWVKAVATAMVTFPYADQVFIGTIA